MLIEQNQKLKLFCISFHLQLFWMQFLVAIDSESCHWSDSLTWCQRLFPSFCVQPLKVAVLFDACKSMESEQTPFFALHRIQFKTCRFFSMSYFNSETNKCLQEWVKRWVLLWSVTSYHEIHWYSISREKDHRYHNVTAQNLKASKYFDSQAKSALQEC